MYDNSVEAVRQDGDYRCPARSERISSPVPIQSITSGDYLHHHHPDDLPLKYDDVCPANKECS